MDFQLGSDFGYDNAGDVGIALRRVADTQNHIGIIYRTSPNEVRFCHLAWHHELRDEIARDDYFWCDCMWVENDDITGRIIAAKMTSISRNKGIIPYGIYFEPPTFSSDGKFLGFSGQGMGLTCATFVVAVFHSMAIFIIKEDTWPDRTDDIAWQESIIRTLENSGADMRHVSSARSHIGAARFRPEEIAAAAVDKNTPLEFSDAHQKAQRIQALLAA